MSTTIPQRDLRNQNAQVIERVIAGESFIVTRDGVPVADVIPHVSSRRPPMFPATAELGAFLDPTGLDATAWLADIRAGDEYIDDDPFADPWARRG